ncbi:MAG: UDP-N-acetylglucosamine 2-epimerase (non-hydrolyzing) [Deltaproteobacteria bacterium]|nr:UDP-N-acetylglucosamine 2-epimerase (non-hydrolyzing) [Deltaproteobacteria bacterium]
MRVMTVFGTRPEIIRLSRVLPLLDAATEHTTVFTGQNFDPALSDVFFDELAVRRPDHALAVRGASFAEQLAQILVGCERVMREVKPERLLLLGDTNSALAAIVAKRMGIAVFHMEAGNRCHDDRVPEEINRRIIDHASDILLPYSRGSADNLLREGIHSSRVFVTGNPIFEVLTTYRAQIDKAAVLARLGLPAGGYLLVSLHRAENVDVDARLRAFLSSFEALSRRHALPVVVSTHPRTRSRIDALGVVVDGDVRMLPPFGFFDFVHLQRHARCVLTDSGTVQEEAAILRVPVVTLRDVTERPETLEHGCNILTGADPGRIAAAVDLALGQDTTWTIPEGYEVPNVSRTVARLLLGHVQLGAAR